MPGRQDHYVRYECGIVARFGTVRCGYDENTVYDVPTYGTIQYDSVVGGNEPNTVHNAPKYQP